MANPQPTRAGENKRCRGYSLPPGEWGVSPQFFKKRQTADVAQLPTSGTRNHGVLLAYEGRKENTPLEKPCHHPFGKAKGFSGNERF